MDGFREFARRFQPERKSVRAAVAGTPSSPPDFFNVVLTNGVFSFEAKRRCFSIVFSDRRHDFPSGGSAAARGSRFEAVRRDSSRAAGARRFFGALYDVAPHGRRFLVSVLCGSPAAVRFGRLRSLFLCHRVDAFRASPTLVRVWKESSLRDCRPHESSRPPQRIVHFAECLRDRSAGACGAGFGDAPNKPFCATKPITITLSGAFFAANGSKNA